MKIIVDSMYDMYCSVKEDILAIHGNESISEKEIGKRAWKLIMDCSERSNLSYEASAAFWLAWGDCKIGRKEIAQRLNELAPHIKKEKTPNNIRDLLNDARIQIKSGIKEKIIEMKLRNELRG